ncbi:repressor LexA [delta proteobacterium NaphS2]|nr:repressor LexA [delta proteobacterium NaphS2]
MMGQKNLTPRQEEIFGFIQEYLNGKGVPPTQKEIAERFNLKGTYGVRQHLRLMEKKGVIRLVRGKARGIRVTSSIFHESDQAIRKIPLLGRIAAGRPLLAVEEVEEVLNIGADVFRGQNLFALRVQGDSMINAGIKAGDIAIINQQPEVQNGEIAAVILDDEATLKRVMLDRDRIFLKAENDLYQDIIVFPDSNQRLHIAGKFVGLIRRNPPLLSNLNMLS